MNHIEITEDAFHALFQPLENQFDSSASFGTVDGNGTMFETYGEEFEFVRGQDPRTVWTLIDGDDGPLISSGYHLVNRLGYFVSKQSLPDDVGITVLLDAQMLQVSSAQLQSMQKLVDYLAHEETHFEECHDHADNHTHIWHDRETLRRMLESEVGSIPCHPFARMTAAEQSALVQAVNYLTGDQEGAYDFQFVADDIVATLRRFIATGSESRS